MNERQTINLLKSKVKSLERKLSNREVKNNYNNSIHPALVDSISNSLVSTKRVNVDSTESGIEIVRSLDSSLPSSGDLLITAIDNLGNRIFLPSSTNIVQVQDLGIIGGSRVGKDIDTEEQGLLYVIEQNDNFYNSSTSFNTGRVYPAIKSVSGGVTYYLCVLSGLTKEAQERITITLNATAPDTGSVDIHIDVDNAGHLVALSSEGEIISITQDENYIFYGYSSGDSYTNTFNGDEYQDVVGSDEWYIYLRADSDLADPLRTGHDSTATKWKLIAWDNYDSGTDTYSSKFLETEWSEEWGGSDTNSNYVYLRVPRTYSPNKQSTWDYSSSKDPYLGGSIPTKYMQIYEYKDGAIRASSNASGDDFHEAEAYPDWSLSINGTGMVYYNATTDSIGTPEVDTFTDPAKKAAFNAAYPHFAVQGYQDSSQQSGFNDDASEWLIFFTASYRQSATFKSDSTHDLGGGVIYCSRVKTAWVDGSGNPNTSEYWANISVFAKDTWYSTRQSGFFNYSDYYFI